MRFRTAVVTFAAALCCASAFAQLKESISVNVVEVPVTVVDSSGTAMRGLTKANFRLIDQGKERPITAFETIDLSVKQSALASMPAAAGRNFMLLFDLSYSAPRSLARAPEAARTFAKGLQPRGSRGGGAERGPHGANPAREPRLRPRGRGEGSRLPRPAAEDPAPRSRPQADRL